MNQRPYLLHPDPNAPFPPIDHAMRNPDGLLAVGGDLTPARLLNAYRSAIFPWYSDGQPILWWSPDPRVVFRTDGGVYLSSRFRRSLRKSTWVVRADTCFRRRNQGLRPHATRGPARHLDYGRDGGGVRGAACLGHAHSVEVFDGDRLVGGIYGVAIGRAFFGESMFSGESGGSKVALAALASRLHEWGWPLIDAQVENAHLMSMGAEYMQPQRLRARQSGT